MNFFKSVLRRSKQHEKSSSESTQNSTINQSGLNKSNNNNNQKATTSGSSVMIETGNVLSFGENMYYQLGRSFRTGIPGLIKGNFGDDVMCTSAGYYHCAVVTRTGQLYTWGLNEEGQCGFPASTTRIMFPSQVPFFADRLVERAACGGNQEVYIFGIPTFPKGKDKDHIQRADQAVLVHTCKEPIKALYASWNNSGILTTDGKLRVWGSGSFGKLGTGSSDDVKPDQSILFAVSKKIVHVAFGFGHTLVVTEDGIVYSCGDNENGQLGNGTTAVNKIPHPVPFFEQNSLKVVKVAAGENHSIAITGTHGMLFVLTWSDSGQVYAWGSNQQGQLGLPHPSVFTSPQHVVDLKDYRIVDATCGSTFTIVITDEGAVFSFGSGSAVLGVGLSKSFQPVSVLNADVIACSATLSHTLLLRGTARHGLSSALFKGYNNPQLFCDIKVKCRDGSSIIAHKLFLHRSPFLTKLLESSEINLDIPYADAIELLSLFYVNVTIHEVQENYAYLFDFETSLASYLEHFVDNKQFSDVKFVSEEDGQEVYAHKVVLCCRCLYFAGMFAATLKEAQENVIHVPYKQETIRLLLTYLYTGKVEASPDDWIELLGPSDVYGVTPLKAQCEHELSQAIEVESVCYLFNIARFHNAERLKLMCLEYIKKEFKQISKLPTYGELDKEERDEIVEFVKK